MNNRQLVANQTKPMEKLTPKEQYNLMVQYAPDDVSPKAYLETVRDHIMGVDSKGNARPFADVLLFLQVSHRAKLDPTLKQIYPVYRWNSRRGKEVMAIQTGIDGFRAAAERTGQYGGSDDGVFEEKDGKPIKATVTVYKLNPVTGDRMAVSASARWVEYVVTDRNGKPTDFWKRMPFTMLEKCAEAKALRKAFPILSGIYTEEEMEQADKITLPKPEKSDKAKQLAEQAREEVSQ